MGTVYAKGVGTIVVLLLDRLSRTFTLWYAIVPHSLTIIRFSSWELISIEIQIMADANLFVFDRRKYLSLNHKKNTLTIHFEFQPNNQLFNHEPSKEWPAINCECFSIKNLRYGRGSISLCQKYLDSDSNDEESIRIDFENYLYSQLYLINNPNILRKEVLPPQKILIWDEYGIEMYKNIPIASISLDSLELNKDVFLVDHIRQSPNSNLYLLGNVDAPIEAILRIRKNNVLFEDCRKTKQGYDHHFNEVDLCAKLTDTGEFVWDFWKRFEKKSQPEHYIYSEICQCMDFNYYPEIWKQSLSVDGTIRMKCQVGSLFDYDFRMHNNIEVVNACLQIKGNQSIKNQIHKILDLEENEAIERKKREQEQELIRRKKEEEARLEKFRYNKRNSHSRDRFISFDETNHTYTVEGNPLQSATNIVENCFPKFNAQLHAKTTAAKMGMTEDEVIAMWEQKGKESRELGTAMHQKIESYYQGKDSREDDAFRLFKMLTDKVRLEPYRTEWAVYDTEYNIAGTIDFVDYQDGKYTIYDWKRSDKIIANGMPVKVSKYQEKGLYPLEHLENCAYYHYALQLSLYKFILEKNYDIKVSDLRLGIFHPSYDKPYVLRMPYLENEVKTLMELRSEVIL